MRQKEYQRQGREEEEQRDEEGGVERTQGLMRETRP